MKLAAKMVSKRKYVQLVMELEDRKKANGLFEQGKLEELYQLLEPYVESNDPFALHLLSSFSLTSFNETDDEFARRSIEQKTLASEGGIAEASYRMGVNYLYGDDVEKDEAQASMFFERAINQGHSYTKFTYGFSLYYGNSGCEKDEDRGLLLMREASDEGVEKATEELAFITSQNNA